MSRQLVDVRNDRHYLVFRDDTVADDLVASLLADGPAEHTIVCSTCEGDGRIAFMRSPYEGHLGPCPDCTNGRQTVIVRAEVKR